jgi:hypothetical protein
VFVRIRLASRQSTEGSLMATLTLDSKTLELAWPGVVNQAAIDARNLAGALEGLAETPWPVRPEDVEEVRVNGEQVRESLTAIDQLLG